MLSISKSTELSKIFEGLSQEDVKAILDWIIEHHWEGEPLSEWQAGIKKFTIDIDQDPQIDILKEMNTWLKEQNEALLYLLGKR